MHIMFGERKVIDHTNKPISHAVYRLFERERVKPEEKKAHELSIFRQ